MRFLSSGKRHKPQSGTAAVEFALVAAILFAFLFGTMEVARALYLWSTLAEVVARAARTAAFTDPNNESQIRYNVMFKTSANKLPLGGEIDPSYLRIDYLAKNQTTVVPPPPCPIQNVINCTNDPLGASCIRFVRVRLCLPGTNCQPVPYTPLVGLDALAAFAQIELPTFATVVVAESLGMPAACTE